MFRTEIHLSLCHAMEPITNLSGMVDLRDGSTMNFMM